MSPDQLVIAPLLVALATAILTLVVRPRPNLQRVVSVLGGVSHLAVSALLATTVIPGTIRTYQVSNWPAPFGITLVADSLAVFMLVLASAVSVGALVFSLSYVDRFGQRVSYHTLFHFMLVGVTGAFLTGDLFNLFVWFEVMLMPSYVLVVFYGGPKHTRAALQYSVLNLVGSAIMLLAIGGIYATTGTLNMADVARRLAAAGEFGIDPAPVLGLTGILFAVFALKAGIAPFQFWVPDTYRAAPAPVAAMLAGVTKKVGVYAIVRLLFTILPAAQITGGLSGSLFSGTAFLAFFGPVLFVMAVASILVGGFGAVSHDHLDGILAHSSIGQVGFIILPLAIAATVPGVRELGIAAALVYAVNHSIAKSLLFLVSGTIRDAAGTVELDRIGGIAGQAPVLSGGFFLGALALVGIPPLTGFFGKFLVFDVATRAMLVDARLAGVALLCALFGAILTIAYLSRAWNTCFWGDPTDLVERAHVSGALVAVTAIFALAVLLFGIGFDPIMNSANAAADAAVAHDAYVEAVDPQEVSK